MVPKTEKSRFLSPKSSFSLLNVGIASPALKYSMTEKARSLSPNLTFLGLYIATPSLEASPKKVKVQIKVLIYPTRP